MTRSSTRGLELAALALCLTAATPAPPGPHLPPGFSLREGQLSVDGETVHWTALVPASAGPHPVLVRVGHPHDGGDKKITRLLELHATDGVPRDAIILQTDVLMALVPGHGLPVDAPELLKHVPDRFHPLVEDAVHTLGGDPRRVYLTGYSYDGVWAWILGLQHPERYAGVVALSAVSYPAAIAGAIDAGAGKNIPVCVLRAQHDHVFPERLEQEQATGARMMADNPRSLWQIVPGTTHDFLWGKASICFRRILGNDVSASLPVPAPPAPTATPATTPRSDPPRSPAAPRP